MLKKLFVFMLFSLTTFFSFGIETKAFETPTQIGFTYDNLFSNLHVLRGSIAGNVACYEIEPSHQSLFIKIAETEPSKTITSRLGVTSTITFYDTTNCSGGNQINRILNFDSAANLNNEFFFSYDEPVFTFKPIRFTILIVTPFTSFAPSGFVNYMKENSFFATKVPTTYEIYSGFSLIKSGFYVDFIPPLLTEPTKSGFKFNYFVDINGDIFNFERTIREDQLDQNGSLKLFARFTEIFVSADPGIQGEFPTTFTSTRPIDIILFNTGFFNTAGFIFLYTIIIIASSILLFYLGASTLINVIADILITVIFMISGYFPPFAAIIMIMLYIIIIITINKSGGLLNE